MITAPRFWWRAPGNAARLLAPLGALYGAIAARRMSRPGERAALPVLCAGNFVVGGAGKTPLAVELARRLAGLGERPAFLTRGHGGSLEGPVLVASAHDAHEVGDEALLLANHAPTVVARSRVAGANLAASTGASVIVMDDGLQNPSLIKDLSFAVVDAGTGIGNGLCLPAGPLRAPLATQWNFIQALVLMQEAGADRGPTPLGEGGEVLAREVLAREVLAREILAREASRRGLPVITASLVPEARMAEALHGRKVVAFAGIGRPAKFFSSLRAIGTVLVAERGFPDHHPFRESEIAALAAEAREAGAALATTEKDMMRVRAVIGAGDSPPLLAGIPLLVLKVGLRVAEGERLDSLVRSALAARRGGGSG